MKETKQERDERRATPVHPANFRCACGCDLRLTKGDLQDANRLLSIAGNERYHVDLTPRPVEERKRRAQQDEYVAKVCADCDEAEVRIEKYQAEFLAKWRAPWPLCKACR